MPIRGVPDEHLAIKGVTSRQKQAVVVGECQVAHLVVVLTEPVDGLLGCIVPDDDVRVLSTLARSQEVSSVRDSEASNCIVMRR